MLSYFALHSTIPNHTRMVLQKKESTDKRQETFLNKFLHPTYPVLYIPLINRAVRLLISLLSKLLPFKFLSTVLLTSIFV